MHRYRPPARALGGRWPARSVLRGKGYAAPLAWLKLAAGQSALAPPITPHSAD